MNNRTGVAVPLVVLAVLTLVTTAYVAGRPSGSDQGSRAPERAGPGDVRSLESEVLSQSIGALEEKHSGDPDNYVLGYALADRTMQRFELEADLADLRRAETVTRTAMRLAPGRAAASARLSLILLAHHEFEQALRAAREGVAVDSTDQSANAALFDAALAVGQPALMDGALRRLRPGSLTRQLREARWLEVTGQSDEAFRTMSRACDRLDASPARRAVVAWCFARLGTIERERSGPDVAARWLQRALSVEAGYRNAIEGLADLAYGRQEWETAERLYARIATDAHPDLYLRLAEVAGARGDAERRQRHEAGFMRATAGPDGERMYARELALYLVSHDELELRDRALALAQSDVARRSTAEGMTVLAWVHLMRAELVEARTASELSLKLSGRAPSPTDRYVRGRVLEALGRDDDAGPLLAAATSDPGLLHFFAQRDLRRRQR